MLDEVLGYLRCPHCHRGLVRTGGVVRCAGAHTFDVARQGYVSLLGGDRPAGAGDSADMVQAREAFLDAGHYATLAETVATLCARSGAEAGPGCVVDIGAGTGYYLRRVLERREGAAGLALDRSRYALRRAARAHPRAGAVACDVWRALPVRSGVAAVALSIFAPRNAAEMRRILRSDGALLVVTPTGAHLAELVDALGLVRVDRRKQDRLREQLGPHFTEAGRHPVELALELPQHTVTDLVAMGPSAWHTDRDTMQRRVAALPDPVAVTASVVVSLHHPAPRRARGRSGAR